MSAETLKIQGGVDDFLDGRAAGSGDIVGDDFRKRAAGKADHGRAAGEGLRHHDSEGFIPKNRHQECRGLSQELILLHIVDRSDIGDLLGEMGLHLLPEVLVSLGADRPVAGDHQAPTGRFGDFDRQVGALDFLNPAKEYERRIRIDFIHKSKLSDPDSIVDCPGRSQVLDVLDHVVPTSGEPEILPR